MKEARLLAAGILQHIRETLQAAHSHVSHGEMLEAIGDVQAALEQGDEEEGLRDLIALSEALDLTIADEDLGKSDGDELEPDDDDEPDEETQP